MRKKQLLTAFLFALLGFGAVSCKKKQKDPTPQEKILGKWRITAWTLRNSDSPTVFDLYAIMESCEKDDYFEYRSGGVLVQNEGATKCGPSDPQEEVGSYTLSADGRTLTMTGSGSTTTFEVLELSATTKKIRNVQVDGGITRTSELTFTKI
ncbi:MAG: hypothetical protein Fur0027_24210 [Raineya sp.]